MLKKTLLSIATLALAFTFTSVNIYAGSCSSDGAPHTHKHEEKAEHAKADMPI